MDATAGLDCPTCGTDLAFRKSRPMEPGERAVVRCPAGHAFDVLRDDDGSLIVEALP